MYLASSVRAEDGLTGFGYADEPIIHTCQAMDLKPMKFNRKRDLKEIGISLICFRFYFKMQEKQKQPSICL